MTRLSRVVLAVLVLLAVVVPGEPAVSVTKEQVDRACSASRAALDEFRESKDRLDTAVENYSAVTAQLEETTLKELDLRAQVTDRVQEIVGIRDRVQDRAVELYMTGANDLSDLLFASSSVGEVLAGRELIEAATEQDVASIDRLSALSSELEILRADLEEAADSLAVLQEDAAAWQSQIEAATQVAATTYDQLQGECKRLFEERERELAIARAREAAKKRGAAGGAPPAATPGFLCPMNPGPTSFTNDWGNPRSGGRTHKGTDMFAPYGQPVYAVANGTVATRTGGLGGTIVWLTSDYGTAYYYAHLSGWGPGISSGVRVTKGQVVGYNGDSGNARGGAPHVHFEIHPGGRGARAVNPYPTLIANGCR